MVDQNNHYYIEDLNDIEFYIQTLVADHDVSMLVTGATGLIGSVLTDAILMHNSLSKTGKINVFILTRNKEKALKRFRTLPNNLFQIIERDINEGFPDEYDFDYIIHLASNADPASYKAYPHETIKTIIMGAVGLSHYLRKHKNTKAVIASTMEVYGELDNDQISENDYGIIDFNNLRSVYPEGKRTAELIIKSAKCEYDINCVIARLGYIYGPSMLDSDNKIISELIRNGFYKKTIELKTAGIQKRTYCYVSDAVNALILLLSKGEPGNAYNIADRHSETTIFKLAELVSSMIGVDFVVGNNHIVRTNTNVVLNPERLEMLGWKAKIHLRDGICRSISAWKP